MNSHLRWALALTMLPLAACSSGNSAAPFAAAPPPALDTTDSTFINSTTAEEATETALSQLAATKARNPRVKRYAAMLVSGHTKSDQKLTALAQSKGFTPDGSMSQDQQGMMTKLQADRPTQFDRDYLHDMVVLNQSSVTAINGETANGQDADVKTFAQQSLSEQQSHLKMARQLGGR